MDACGCLYVHQILSSFSISVLNKTQWLVVVTRYVVMVFMYIFIQVPKVSVDLAIKSWPLLLGCSVSKLKVMVEQFGELGVRNKKLGRVITRSPQLLLRKPQEVLQVSARNSFSVSSFYGGKVSLILRSFYVITLVPLSLRVSNYAISRCSSFL